MKSGGYQQPMTSQKDSRLIYRKKRMPVRKRKQWTSFKRKVTAVEISNKQLQMCARQQTMFLTTAANTSTYCFAGLYGLAGGVGSVGTTGVSSGTGQCDDIADIFMGKYGTAAISAGKKLMFASACLDVHIQVTGAANLVLEVYEIVARKDFAAMSAAYDQVEEIYTQAFADLPAMGGLPSATGSTLGTTPFNSKTFCQYFRINKKYRVQASPGELLSFQLRDPKNHLIDGNVVSKPQMNWHKGEFKGFFFQMYGCPTTTPTAGTLSSAAECKVTSIKSYTFRQFDAESAAAAQAN